MTSCTSSNPRYFEQAKALYEKGEYQEARDLCEKKLIDDPYNIEAVRFVNKITKAMYEDAKKKYPPYEGCTGWIKIEKTDNKKDARDCVPQPQI